MDPKLADKNPIGKRGSQETTPGNYGSIMAGFGDSLNTTFDKKFTVNFSETNDQFNFLQKQNNELVFSKKNLEGLD